MIPNVRPSPTPEEAAAIMAVLQTLRDRSGKGHPPLSRWELSGRLGRVVPVGRKLETSPWSHPRLEGEW